MRAPRVIATTGDELVDLGPYVPAVSDAGVVVFQATLRDGGSAVLVADGRGALVEAGPTRPMAITSHPDVDDEDRICVYGVDPDGVGRVLALDGQAVEALAETGGSLVAIGPTGPTMDDHGRVAFRADTVEGRSGLYLARREGVVEVAVTGDEWTSFHGLPVVFADGAVLFRGDRPVGVEAIAVWREGRVETVAETGGALVGLGRFPSATESGSIGYAETHADGAGAIVRVEAGRRDVVLETGTRFASVRGALVAASGASLALATPVGGGLGLFAGPDPAADRIVAIGDELLGSTVVDLAANPVSINAAAQVAVRIRLADGRQLVVAFDPD